MKCRDCKYSLLSVEEEPCKSCDYFGSNGEPKEEEMNYPKLEIFDVVELRDGRLAVVLLESERPDERTLGLYSRNYEFNPEITSINNFLFDRDAYDGNLIHHSSPDLDIMKVLKYSKISVNPSFSHEAYIRMVTDIVIRRDLCWDDFKNFNIKERIAPYDWTWVREEEYWELTMADIEEKFGHKVKIIKG